MEVAVLIIALLALIASVAAVVLLLQLLQRKPEAAVAPALDKVDKLEATLRDQQADLRNEFAQNRGESLASSRQLKDDVSRTLDTNRQTLEASISQLVDSLAQVGAGQAKHLQESRGAQSKQLEDFGVAQRQQLSAFSQQLANLSQLTEIKLSDVRGTLENRIKQLQDDNAKRLELMRATVDEKLQGTLERRLGESFKLVSDRLEQVHKGLGEMQNLASGVGALQRVLTNVKTRGTWGEVQLRALLEQVLVPDQYAENIATLPGSSERVEFAVRLPGAGSGESRVKWGGGTTAGGHASTGLFGDDAVWIPIDSKFPLEAYQRLIEAADRGHADDVEAAGKQLENQLRLCARTIREKYIGPPHTTDFAILYLPTEGLYAEVLRRPGLCDLLQREHRVNVAGPTTLWAILNSLQMGFRTLAIQKRSSEVWSVLGAVKTEFGKFGEILDKVKKKLDEATTTIDQTGVRTRAIERKLRDVEALPATDTSQLLGSLEVKPSAEESVDRRG